MEKLNILLSCSYGFSTSSLVKKMETYCQEKGYPFTVNALAETNALESIDDYNVVLIGPQVRYLKPKFDNAIKGKIPVYVMDTRSYGRLQVGEIVEQMLDDMREEGYYE
ncbi:PTS system cellobiose-specific IIB component [Entomoplasma freundtii]|uniref:PTS sugar transporter subunit IIB n=1 Tax=Entomoplasma freundtii TaxID=74700 RepID=A0A2K8NU79_9MOLU|nr:PTS sugar transporter subunit IIB [Entomoplasma freundtii]ATZ16321.1 PTS sugar transporter subunit IIB [Entomoplasma freundtii]TDY56640.1 PTS system cellobiose-specific IIB component [Entomoplasma freundtii]